MNSRVPRAVIGVIAAATIVLTLGGATGAWPVGAPAFDYRRAGHPAVATHPTTPPDQGAARDRRDVEADGRGVRGSGDAPEGASEPHEPDGSATVTSEPDGSDASHAAAPDADRPKTEKRTGPTVPPLPKRSGSGRRVVFDIGGQRVWLVGKRGTVRRTYPVSGSRYDNLSPGRYAVSSRSRHATSFTFDETMDYMVRFAEGQQSSIGFHDIPVDANGEPVQTRRQLGRPLSAGCVRQARRDAVALWRFAGIGTEVVVTG